MSSGVSLQEAASRSVLLNSADISKMGHTLIVAPHPDDESLACGGIISLLQTAGNAVYVLFISDGSMSHPNSVQYPAASLMELRESEALDALSILGVPAEHAFFLRLKDAQVPLPGAEDFDTAVAAMEPLLHKVQPDTVILPWRRDTHPDHRAAWCLMQAVIQKMNLRPAMLEYPLWLWERGQESDLPAPGEVNFYRIDISSVLHLKQQAITAHRSQVSGLIDDDPQGFRLTAGMLAHFNTSFETFLEKI